MRHAGNLEPSECLVCLVDSARDSVCAPPDIGNAGQKTGPERHLARMNSKVTHRQAKSTKGRVKTGFLNHMESVLVSQHEVADWRGRDRVIVAIDRLNGNQSKRAIHAVCRGCCATFASHAIRSARHPGAC